MVVRRVIAADRVIIQTDLLFTNVKFHLRADLEHGRKLAHAEGYLRVRRYQPEDEESFLRVVHANLYDFDEPSYYNQSNNSVENGSDHFIVQTALKNYRENIGEPEGQNRAEKCNVCYSNVLER